MALIGDAAAEAKAERAGFALVRAQSEGINSAGGFFVPAQLANVVINLRERYGTFRRNAQVVPLSSDVSTVPRRTADLAAVFVGEGQSLTETTTSWDEIQLVAKKIGSLVKISSELYEDSVIDIGNEIAEQLAFAFAKKEDECGWVGDGTSTYGGIRGVTVILIDGNHDAGKVAATTGHNLLTEIGRGRMTSTCWDGMVAAIEARAAEA